MNAVVNRRVVAPGRVNLIGDHTDYTGGLVLPMAIDRYTELRCVAGGPRVHLTSHDDTQPIDLPLHIERPEDAQPAWAKYVAGVIAEMSPGAGLRGSVATNIPIGAGLSSSAALEIAIALALGFTGSPLELAQLCQRAENRATGLPSGIMDQLAIASGVADHALMIDCGDLTISPVKLPADIDIVVQFIAHRRLVGSPYKDRVAECATAEREIGPLRQATMAQARSINDPLIRARAQHVIGENQRVTQFVAALEAGHLADAGRLMIASHDSLRDLYQTSTPTMDAAVTALLDTPGVHGARMTGGGFGGCVVAVTEPGAVTDGWLVRAVGAAAAFDDSAPQREE